MFERLAILEDRLIDETEVKAIKIFNSLTPNGYNIETGGNACKKLSEITKRKLSEKLKGRTSVNKGKPMLPQVREALQKSRSKRVITKEDKELLLKYAIKPKSEETKRKMSEAQKGKIFSKETRIKMSNAKLGRKLSEETKVKMSVSRTGRIVSEETRKKISESNKLWKRGPRSEEAKRKTSESLKLAYKEGRRKK